MPIEFECRCGTVLRAKDEHAGKTAHCPTCRTALVVPPTLQLQEPQALGAQAARACPDCGESLAQHDVVCMNCGLNTRTGRSTAMRAEVVRPARGLWETLHLKKVLAAAVGLVVLGVGWFCVAAPIIAKLNISSARGYVTNGDLTEALAQFQALQPEVSGSDRARVNLWIRQLQLEMETNTGSILSQGKLVSSALLRMKVSAKPVTGSGMLFNVDLVNESDTPLTIINGLFYVRGLSDIVLVASHTDNTFDGVVIEPGDSASGVVAFRKVPDHPVRRRIGRQTQTAYYLVFNDGDRYVKMMLPF